VVHRRDCHRVDTVGITVEVALVALSSTIARGEDKDGPLACPPFVDSIDHCFLDNIARPFHRDAVVWRPPTAAIYRDILVTIVEGCCFVNVRYRS
jgi:hypothetical protein